MAQRWYVVHAHTNFEKKVAQGIRDGATQKGLTENISEIMVPTETAMEVRRGAKHNVERKIYPGYVLVKMDLTDETWNMIKQVPKVTGFLGGGGKPAPISEKEAMAILQQVEEGVARPKSTLNFDVGENVRVIDGPFNSFTGSVEEVDSEKGRLKVSVSIFGRATPVDLDFAQVEKIK
ncbi:MAG: transcription termination/antitermination protein NusG [Bdellovibrionales bacterium]